MASKGNEHRMVFDIRGKRRHVVKFVYAILALLMGASLFLVVGPVNIGELFGGGTSAGNAAKPFEEQAERIELKLKKSPEDADLLAALTRARINAGNSSTEVSGEQQVITSGTVQQYQLASDAWSRYVKATDEPAVGVALVAAPTFIALAETSGINEFEANVKAAAEAQQIVAEQRPSIGSLSTLAIYQYFSFDYEQARKTEAEAVALAEDKFQRESAENQLQEYEKRAKELQKELQRIEQASKAAGGGSGSKESLENPLGGLGSGGFGE
jgi:DNA repair exonuclease SbcCD ATPase subunit